MALKRPNAISFSKKNDIRPFEDATSLDFWASKNDASLFVIGQDTKKRPDGLTFVRMFDGRVLDICEVGVTNFVSMTDLQVSIFDDNRSSYFFIFYFSLFLRRQNRLQDIGH